MVMEFHLGETLRLKKTHPCGSDQWEVVRLGADIGLRCLGCGRRVLMERPTLERRIRGPRPAPGAKATPTP
ncbi:MAG: DUF951 domain-containing protein [Chloroflexi bacterium]|nr:DUF951 domain-containing protein [Chloroflexota bacterium]